MIRIGQSSDVHKLVEGRKLILGGVEIPHHKGCLAHSDGDALLHAISESLLGALALGDLGKHFPDTNIDYKDISSLVILKKVFQIVEDKGYMVGNIDSLIMIENPKMAMYIEEMRSNIAFMLKTDIYNISVKATRGEGIGFVGREEGLMAQAVVLLKKVDNK